MPFLKNNPSVMRRLLLLVVATIVSYAVILGVGLYCMRQIAKDSSFLYRFQLVSIEEIATAYPETSNLRTVLLASAPDQWGYRDYYAWEHSLSKLRNFQERYDDQWRTVQGVTEDARRFRADIAESGQSHLLSEESQAFGDFNRELATLDDVPLKESNVVSLTENILNIQRALVSLLGVNSKYASAAHLILSERANLYRIFAVIVSLVSVVLTTILCFNVRSAIAPRIHRLVEKVRHFQERGVNEKIQDTGDDEIAVLANAIDAGFSAIENREKDRERFLAIAAHELKTPITSIYGFSSFLVEHPEEVDERNRAVEVINRQSWRLSRLVEDLFLAVKARSGQLRFRPESVELTSLLKKAAQEVEPFLLKQEIEVNENEKIFVLGDETLLSHALWSLLSQASTLSGATEPLKVNVQRQGTFASIVINLSESNLTDESMQVLFTPFHSVEFEGQVGARASMGLYLCREIVKLHNGRLNAYVGGGGTYLQMELPA